MEILILSDTHGLLRPQVREMLGKCDALIHCGDYHTSDIIEEIRDAVCSAVPVFLVRGNNDGEWAGDLPKYLEFILGGVRFCVVHDKKDLSGDLGNNQVVLFGHSHRYMEEWKDGRLWLNPGSCGRRRFRLDITMAILHLEDGKISVEKVLISDGAVRNTKEDLPGTIQNIMKRMDKGQRIDRISRDLGVGVDFVEDICRIRVTHPGVSAEGILNKIEVNESRH